MSKPLVAAVLALLVGAPSATPAAAQESISLTVYEADFALVRHRRQYDLSAGENNIRLEDLGEGMQVDTVLVRHGANPSMINVLELVYRHQPLTPQALLQAHIGKRVGVLRTHPLSDADTRVEAVLLSIEGGTVLRIGERIETAPPGRIVFDDLPPALTARPSLDLRLVSQDSGKQPVEISYLSRGFDWQADYVAEIDASGESLSLDAWAALSNTNNTAIAADEVQLVSGHVNRETDAAPPMRRMQAAMLAAESDATTPQRENLASVHLYRLPRPVRLGAGETRRLSLLSARQVPVENIYTLAPQAPHLYQSRYAAPEQRLPVQRRVRLYNRASHNLGRPLPAGLIRVYQRDARGDQQLVGEDRIEHTPENESILLTLGDAVDLLALKSQLSFRKMAPSEPYRNVYGSEFRVRLVNAGTEAVNVEVVEALPGDWRIDKENLPHERRNAGEATWVVTVPAAGEAELRYQAVVRF